MKDILTWTIVGVFAVDVLFFWYSRLWLVLLNALVALGVTVLAFLNGLDPTFCLLAVLVTVAAGQSLHITEYGDEFDPLDDEPCQFCEERNASWKDREISGGDEDGEHS